MVAYSYALRKNEPSPCNARIGNEVKRIYNEFGNNALIVAQWEVALRLKELEIPVALTVHNNVSGRYFDSLDVWEAAKGFFSRNGITTVIPVAQPFVHLPLLRWRYMKDEKFVIVNEPIQCIGHDKLSEQWWTRGPLRLVSYVLLRPLLRLGR